jgi:hypothetical protein
LLDNRSRTWPTRWTQDMAFDENLAGRIRKALSRKKGVEEKKMFGGGVFMLNGNMLVGVWKDSLIVRLGNEQAEAALLDLKQARFSAVFCSGS